MGDITGIGSIADLASTVIDKIFPDKTKAAEAKAALAQAQLEGSLKSIDDRRRLGVRHRLHPSDTEGAHRVGVLTRRSPGSAPVS